MRKDNTKTIVFFLGPTMLIIIGILYLPIIINFVNSLYDWGALSAKRSFIGIENYIKMFKDQVFYTALKNNFVFIVMSIICQIGLSLVIAAVLEQEFMRKYQGFFRTVYFIPSLLMMTVMGLTFKMIYSPSIGVINPLLELFGVNTSKIDLLGNSETAIYAVAAASQWQFIGYTVILFLVAMQHIPHQLFEAAEIDGAGPVRKFLYVTIPQVRDTIMINMIIVVTGAIRVFDEVFVMTSGGPGHSSDTLATMLYNAGFNNDQMGYASAIAFFVFVVTFILGLFQLKGYAMDDIS